ncbi:hypothetical protein [Dyadobacter psychrotolerans]|nr:hypothetical protein [Dyadobacter psychrotolerans]
MTFIDEDGNKVSVLILLIPGQVKLPGITFLSAPVMTQEERLFEV